MNLRRTFSVFAGSTAASLVAIWAIDLGIHSSTFAQDRRGRERRSDQEEVELLTQGPVHEAFAEPIVFEPESGVVVTQQPPEPVEEIPPEDAPADVDAVWIPGYWNWDQPHGEFIWVSGFWRVLPPDMDWVPGYWAESGRGYVWVSGFWRPTDLKEVAYLPEPPASLDQGPVGDPPSDDHIWVNGTWVWNDNRYAWRPGYYIQARPDWIWTPAHYVWSPMGYVFVDGFWDRSIQHRGVLFAPAYFRGPVPRGYVLRPSVVIDTNLFVDHLFVQPRYGHYYFGDYYDYVGVGLYPWFEFHMGHYGYDPIFAYYHWHHGHDRQWYGRLRDDFRYRHDHRDARPPHRWSEMESVAARGSRNDRSLAFATTLEKYKSRQDSAFKFTKLEESRRDEIKQRSSEFRDYKLSRVKLESESSDKSALKAKESTKLQLTASPLATRENAGKGRDKAPDKPKTPELDIAKEAKNRDRDRDAARLRDEDRSRGRDQDRTFDRPKADRQKTDQDRSKADQSKSKVDPRDRQDRRGDEQLNDRTKGDRTRPQSDRDRTTTDPSRGKTDIPGRRDDIRSGDRSNTDQQRERARSDQSKSKVDPRDERRERGYLTPDPARPKDARPKDNQSNDRNRADESRPKTDGSRDRTKSDQVRPKDTQSTDRNRANDSRPKDARPKDQSNDRNRADESRPKTDGSRERAKPDQLRSNTDRSDNRGQDRGKAEQARPRPDAARERSPAKEPGTKANDRPGGNERDSRKESARPNNERPNQPQQPATPSGNRSGADRGKADDRAKEAKDKEKDKEKRP